MNVSGRLIAPPKKGDVPQQAQWLTGEGGGAWFCIQKKKTNYRIKRYTPEGNQDCDREFQLKNTELFDDSLTFEMQHISHCAEVRVLQNGVLFVFEWIGE